LIAMERIATVVDVEKEPAAETTNNPSIIDNNIQLLGKLIDSQELRPESEVTLLKIVEDDEPPKNEIIELPRAQETKPPPVDDVVGAGVETKKDLSVPGTPVSSSSFLSLLILLLRSYIEGFVSPPPIAQQAQQPRYG